MLALRPRIGFSCVVCSGAWSMPVKTDAADQNLDRVFGAKSAPEVGAAYDEWAKTYDEDMLSVGYVHPAIAAAMIARYVRDLDQPILDAGCGTGTNGQILSTIGYSALSGLDLSKGMLERARERGVYSGLHEGVLGGPLPFPDDIVGAVVSTGVFTLGHAPPSAFDELLRLTRHGGYLVFSVARSVWNEGGFRPKLAGLETEGRCQLVEETPWYHAMPFSGAERATSARMFVYRVAKTRL